MRTTFVFYVTRRYVSGTMCGTIYTERTNIKRKVGDSFSTMIGDYVIDGVTESTVDEDILDGIAPARVLPLPFRICFP